MSEPRIRIGTVGYPVKNRARVLENVGVVELVEGRQVPPSARTARKWKTSAPGGVGFTVQLSRYLFDTLEEGATLPGDPAGYGGLQLSEENRGLWKRELEYAGAMGALAMIMLTPAELSPAPVHQDRLAEFLAHVDRGGFPIVWEPHGPWEVEQAARFAADNNIVLAVDPLRDPAPEGDFAYFRMGPFAAMGSRVGLYDLERLSEAADNFERCICVFETPRALDDARNLAMVIAGEEPQVDF